MYLAVKELVPAYATITANIPNFSTNLTSFLGVVTQISALAVQQKTSKKGLASNKNTLKNTLATQTADMARKLTTYATFTNNANLLEEVKMTESGLKLLPDTAVSDFAQIIYAKVQSNLASLTNYGLTAATQTAYMALITSYTNSIGKPRAGQSDGKSVTKQLANLYRDADKYLRNIDLGVEVVRLSQVNFYNAYHAARKVIDSGNGKLSLKVLVKDADTDEALKIVTVTVVLKAGGINPDGTPNETGGTGKMIVKKTADKGGFTLKGLADGQYVVTLKKVGYVTQTHNINVTSGELTKLTVKLKKG